MVLFPHGSFLIDRYGVLQPREPARAPALRFAWRGRRCQAAMSADGIRIETILGRIPSTAEGADRPQAFATLAELPARLPAGWRLRLLPDHRIRLEAATETAGPATATKLLAAMVRFALALDPYLDRLDSVGATASGTANSCPG